MKEVENLLPEDASDGFKGFFISDSSKLTCKELYARVEERYMQRESRSMMEEIALETTGRRLHDSSEKIVRASDGSNCVSNQGRSYSPVDPIWSISPFMASLAMTQTRAQVCLPNLEREEESLRRSAGNENAMANSLHGVLPRTRLTN